MEYIGLFKKITESWVFNNPIILKVFIYFLCTASDEFKKVDVNGVRVSLIPGQLVSGRKALMDALSLTERQARGALEALSENKVISVNVSSTYSIVTLLKYSHYQGIVKKNIPNDVQQSQVLDKPDRTLSFDKFWAEYPKKQAKITAVVAWKKHVTKSAIPDVMKGLSMAKKSEQWTKDGGKYIPMPSTWLNQHRWEDEYDIEPSIPSIQLQEEL